MDDSKPCIDYARSMGTHIADRAFFPTTGDKHSYRHAREICERCPIATLKQCLADEFRTATNLSSITGFRAGLTPKERKRLYRIMKEQQQ